jgi:hypothetical protein
MRTRLTLKPGQNGTKKLLHVYGRKLVAVRYRYDAAQRLRFKTVELVVEQLPWIPPLPSDRSAAELVFVRINYEEAELRLAVRQAGGKWDPERKLWQLRLGTVYELGLDQRIARMGPDQ